MESRRRGEAQEPVGPNALILLAEDDEALQRVATRALERRGYRVIVADSAEAALARYHERRDEIAMVLTDVSMPSNSGFELYDAIVRAGAPPPVLFMSGYDDEEMTARGLAPGAAFLRKPWTIDELLEAVAQVLRGSTGGAA